LRDKRRYYVEIHLDDRLYARTAAKKTLNGSCFWGENFEFKDLPRTERISLLIHKDKGGAAGMQANAVKRAKKTKKPVGRVRISVSSVQSRLVHSQICGARGFDAFHFTDTLTRSGTKQRRVLVAITPACAPSANSNRWTFFPSEITRNCSTSSKTSTKASAEPWSHNFQSGEREMNNDVVKRGRKGEEGAL